MKPSSSNDEQHAGLSGAAADNADAPVAKVVRKRAVKKVVADAAAPEVATPEVAEAKPVKAKAVRAVKARPIKDDAAVPATIAVAESAVAADVPTVKKRAPRAKKPQSDAVEAVAVVRAPVEVEAPKVIVTIGEEVTAAPVLLDAPNEAGARAKPARRGVRGPRALRNNRAAQRASEGGEIGAPAVVVGEVAGNVANAPIPVADQAMAESRGQGRQRQPRMAASPRRRNWVCVPVIPVMMCFRS
jgi:23S rRNA pseudouridine2605 synthase